MSNDEAWELEQWSDLVIAEGRYHPRNPYPNTVSDDLWNSATPTQRLFIVRHVRLHQAIRGVA